MEHTKHIDGDLLFALIDGEIDRGSMKDSAYYALRMVQEMIESMPDLQDPMTEWHDCPDCGAPCPTDPDPKENYIYTQRQKPGKPFEVQTETERKISVEIEAVDVADLRVQLRELLDFTDNPEFWKRFNAGTSFDYSSSDGVFYDREEPR